MVLNARMRDYFAGKTYCGKPVRSADGKRNADGCRWPLLLPAAQNATATNRPASCINNATTVFNI